MTDVILRSVRSRLFTSAGLPLGHERTTLFLVIKNYERTIQPSWDLLVFRVARSKTCPHVLTYAVLLAEHDGTRRRDPMLKNYLMLKLLPRISLEGQSSIYRSFSRLDDAAAVTIMAATTATATAMVPATASFLATSKENVAFCFADDMALRALSLGLAADQTFCCWCWW